VTNRDGVGPENTEWRQNDESPSDTWASKGVGEVSVGGGHEGGSLQRKDGGIEVSGAGRQDLGDRCKADLGELHLGSKKWGLRKYRESRI
jgi:hypothetical protein